MAQEIRHPLLHHKEITVVLEQTLVFQLFGVLVAVVVRLR
jgi:hypothetical protein